MTLMLMLGFVTNGVVVSRLRQSIAPKNTTVNLTSGANTFIFRAVEGL
jgi:hypothetical protein